LLLSLRFQTSTPRVTALLCGEIGIALMIWILAQALQIEPQLYKVSQIEDRGEDIGNYLVAYLLPFLAVPEPSVGDSVAYIGFLLIAGLIYIRSDLVYVNPLLYVLGFRVSKVSTVQGYSGILISKRRYAAGDEFEAARIRDLVLVDFK
jgi:hypothetical protein